jgi:hypothetical protein
MTDANSFLIGKLVDENGVAPRKAYFTIVTAGAFQGRRGFIRVGSDQEVRADGAFTSPSLPAGRYFLRFFGVLQNNPSNKPQDHESAQRRVFDFVYPNAATVQEALPFDLHLGESINSVFEVPKPAWFNVSGRFSGDSTTCDQRMSVMFQRDMGILDGVGGLGFPLQPDGSFEGMLLKGAYKASIHEMTDSEPSGYARSTRQVSSAVVTIERDTFNLKLSLQ